MRIWILDHYAVPPDGAFGTRHAVLGKHLQDAGHSVTVFASATPHHGRYKTVDIPAGQVYTDQMYDGLRFRFVKTRPYKNSAERMLNMMSYRQSVLHATDGLQPPEVVLGSCVHLHAGDAARCLAQRYGVPYVFEVRDIWPDSLVELGAFGRNHPAYLYLRAVELRQYRHAAAVAVAAPGMVEYMVNHGVPKKNVWYIPNGIDPSLYPPTPPPPDEGTFTVSFFGSHGPANALDTIVRAAALLQDDERGRGVFFRLVGDGLAKPGLEALAESLQLRNFEFRPPMPRRDLAPLAAESHAFVFHLLDMPVLKKYGISSNKLFDYLIAARPIVFACNSYNDPIKEAGAGISVPPQDPRAMAEAILQLRALSVEERARMGAAGRAWVLEHHSMPKLAEKMEQMFRSVVPGAATAQVALR